MLTLLFLMDDMDVEFIPFVILNTLRNGGIFLFYGFMTGYFESVVTELFYQFNSLRDDIFF